MKKYSVNVDNVGNIECESMQEAQKTYNDFVSKSKSGRGSAAGSNVYLMQDGEPIKEFMGSGVEDDSTEFRTGGVAKSKIPGNKHVDVTKGYRLPHGYKAVKGEDKNKNYSKGKPKVKVTPGWRLPKGYEVADGAYNMKYEKGGTLEVKDGEDVWYLTYIDSTHFFLSNTRDFKGSAYHVGQFRGRPFYNEVNEWLGSHKGKYAQGGNTSTFEYSIGGL